MSFLIVLSLLVTYHEYVALAIATTYFTSAVLYIYAHGGLPNRGAKDNIGLESYFPIDDGEFV